MRIGYARVSTHEQNLNLQKDALRKARCEKLFVDVASGNHARRTGLEQARAVLRKGDVLVVWRLDRLGRSLKQLGTLQIRDSYPFLSLLLSTKSLVSSFSREPAD